MLDAVRRLALALQRLRLPVTAEALRRVYQEDTFAVACPECVFAALK